MRRHQILLRREVVVERGGAHAQGARQLRHDHASDARTGRPLRELAQDALPDVVGLSGWSSALSGHRVISVRSNYRTYRRARGSSEIARSRPWRIVPSAMDDDTTEDRGALRRLRIALAALGLACLLLIGLTAWA